MTRKLAKAGGAYLGGMMAASFLALTFSLALGAAAAAAGICALAFFRPLPGSRKYTAAVCGLFCGMGLLTYGVYDLFTVRPAGECGGLYFEGSGVVCMAEHYQSSSLYAAEFTLPGGSKGKAAFYLYDGSRLVKGDSVTVSGTLCVPDSSGFFDSRSYFYSRGIFLTLQDTQLNDFTSAPNNIFRLADDLRLKTAARIRSITNSSSSGELLIGMLFGGGFCDLDEKSLDMLSRSGIRHISAVSGLHMSIAAGLAAAAAGALGLSKRAKFAAVILAAAVFALCADFTMSVTRSFVMILLVYSAGQVQRRSDPLTSLAAAMLIITGGCPYIIRNTSLLLSGSGVLGAAVIAPKALRQLENIVNARTKRTEPYRAGGFVSSAVTCICAYCAVFPLSCLTFDEVSVISPVVNLFLSPFFTAAVSMGVIGAVAGNVSFLAPFGNIAVRSGSFICGIILKAAEFAGNIRGAVIPAGSEILPLFIVITLLAGLAGFAFTSRKSYGMLIFSAAVFICSLSLSAVRAVPSGVAEIAVITEGNGCALVIYDDVSTRVMDFSGNSSCARAVKKFITRKGLAKPSQVIAYSEKAAGIYSKKFYDAHVICPDGEDGYVTDRDIITWGDARVVPKEGCFLIDLQEISIAVVNRKGGFEAGNYGLIVINSYAKADYENNACYVITKRKFSGSLPAGSDAVFCECAYYRVTSNGIERRSEHKWLK